MSGFLPFQPCLNLNKNVEIIDKKSLETKSNNTLWSVTVMPAITPINNQSFLNKIKHLLLIQISTNRWIRTKNVPPFHDVRLSMPVLRPIANQNFKLNRDT